MIMNVCKYLLACISLQCLIRHCAIWPHGVSVVSYSLLAATLAGGLKGAQWPGPEILGGTPVRAGLPHTICYGYV